MEWTILFDEDFSKWFEALEEGLRQEILAWLMLLRRFGPALGRPQVDTIKWSKHAGMKELRVQYKGDPWRILFAFDPERRAILLVGGDKTGDERWYKKNVPLADARFDKHLEQVKKAQSQAKSQKPNSKKEKKK